MDLGGDDRCLFFPGKPGGSHRIAFGTGNRERMTGAWGGKFSWSNGKPRPWGGLDPAPGAVGVGGCASHPVAVRGDPENEAIRVGSEAERRLRDGLKPLPPHDWRMTR